ncbi:MAG: hypothetical protein ACYCSW_10745 [bacterium]
MVHRSISLGGVFIALEFTIFAYIVGNHFTDSTGQSGFTPLTAILLLIIMIILPLAGPILLHKIFGLHGAHDHAKNTRQATKAEGKESDSGKMQMMKGATKLAAGDPSGIKDIMEGSRKSGSNKSSEQSQTYGPVAGGVAPGVSDYKQ